VDKIENHTFPLKHQSRTGKCRKVVVACDVRVPPLSERDVEAYAVLPDLRGYHSAWATQPFVLGSGLIVAGTLLPEKTLDLALRVLNPTRKEIRSNEGLQCMTEDVVIETESEGSAAALLCAEVKESVNAIPETESETESDSPVHKSLRGQPSSPFPSVCAHGEWMVESGTAGASRQTWTSQVVKVRKKIKFRDRQKPARPTMLTQVVSQNQRN